jgi:hypothetical protein
MTAFAIYMLIGFGYSIWLLKKDLRGPYSVIDVAAVLVIALLWAPQIVLLLWLTLTYRLWRPRRV